MATTTVLPDRIERPKLIAAVNELLGCDERDIRRVTLSANWVEVEVHSRDDSDNLTGGFVTVHIPVAEAQ